MLPSMFIRLWQLRFVEKSALLACHILANHLFLHFSSYLNCLMVHILPIAAAKTLEEYAERVYLPFIYVIIWRALTELIECVGPLLCRSSTMSSLKELTRVHRESGLRTKVSGQVQLPRK